MPTRARQWSRCCARSACRPRAWTPRRPPWRRCARRGEGGAPFEAALCDWRLRDGEDGLAAAQRLRAAGGGLHVLMVTGETDPLRLQALQASGLPVLFKPVEARHLVSALVIDRASGRSAAVASA